MGEALRNLHGTFAVGACLGRLTLRASHLAEVMGQIPANGLIERTPSFDFGRVVGPRTMTGEGTLTADRTTRVRSIKPLAGIPGIAIDGCVDVTLQAGQSCRFNFTVSAPALPAGSSMLVMELRTLTLTPGNGKPRSRARGFWTGFKIVSFISFRLSGAQP